MSHFFSHSRLGYEVKCVHGPSGCQRQCHGCLVHFVDNANYPFLCAMEISVWEEITCKRQNNSFLFNNCTSQTIIQNVINTKTEFWRTIMLTSFQKLTMSSRFCPFVPSFVFAVLLIPSLNFLSDYFLVCQVGGSSYCLKFDKSRDTAPLMTRWSL